MRWFKNLYRRIRFEIEYRRKLRKNQKDDPFIYF